MSKSYTEKLKDPRWQKKRLEIMDRDNFSCVSCDDNESMLSVHHMYYESGKDPWEYPSESLVTLCEHCHQLERSFRNNVEKIIIDDLRKIILFDDLSELSIGIHLIDSKYSHKTVIGYITWLMQHKNNIDPLIHEYLNRNRVE